MSARLEPKSILKDRYRILRKISDRGFSLIYLVRDTYAGITPMGASITPLLSRNQKAQ